MKGLLTSKLTERSQTTLPKAVKEVLAVDAGGRLGYVIDGNTVRLVNAETFDQHEDVVAQAFLSFLERDLVHHPERIALFPAALLERARATAARVTIDHDAETTGAILL